MKRISLSTELKDWVPGVYSTLESQLQFVSEFLQIESPIFHSGNCSSYSIVFNKCYELGLFDGLVVRNLAILLRVRTLKLANPAETVKAIFVRLRLSFLFQSQQFKEFIIIQNLLFLRNYQSCL